ncbi:MAG: cyclic nucleotide-binding domain-containing protein [Armatimonadetes bacterium]|nr:cyclic nucleotide-binding domain-containing protein [Armatimonadota bacterium]
MPTPAALEFLRRHTPLSHLDEHAADRVVAEMDWIVLEPGDTLMRQGDVGDALFILIYGRLEVTVRDGEGHDLPLAIIRPGEPIGEMAVLSDEPRSATIRALRRAVLARFTRGHFLKLVAAHPDVLLAFTSFLGGRRCRTRLTFSPGWSASNPSIGWTRSCLQSADTLIFLASGDESPPAALEAVLATVPPLLERRLVLLHAPETRMPSGTAAWLEALPVSAHHHVRHGNAPDVERLARFLSGRAVGLALAGGSARGLAHIGYRDARRRLEEGGFSYE